MDQAQRAQRFHQVQLARVELAKILVAGQDVAHLPHLLGAVAGQHHPQVLDGRAHAAVVEVDEMGAGVGPQDIAAMAIAVQAQLGQVPGPVVAPAHAVERLLRNGGVRLGQVGRNEAIGLQERARFGAKGGDVERRTVLIRPDGAHGVDAADEAPGPFQHFRGVELRCAAAMALEHGKTEAVEMVQRGAVGPQGQGRHHGNFARGQRPSPRRPMLSSASSTHSGFRAEYGCGAAAAAAVSSAACWSAMAATRAAALASAAASAAASSSSSPGRSFCGGSWFMPSLYVARRVYCRLQSKKEHHATRPAPERQRIRRTRQLPVIRPQPRGCDDDGHAARLPDRHRDRPGNGDAGRMAEKSLGQGSHRCAEIQARQGRGTHPQPDHALHERSAGHVRSGAQGIRTAVRRARARRPDPDRRRSVVLGLLGRHGTAPWFVGPDLRRSAGTDAGGVPAGRRRNRRGRTGAGGRPGQGPQAGARPGSEPAGHPQVLGAAPQGAGGNRQARRAEGGPQRRLPLRQRQEDAYVLPAVQAAHHGHRAILPHRSCRHCCRRVRRSLLEKSPALCRPRPADLGRLHGPGQLGHGHPGRLPVRLPAAVHGSAVEPCRHRAAMPEHAAGHRHRQRPGRALPRAVRAADRGHRARPDPDGGGMPVCRTAAGQTRLERGGSRRGAVAGHADRARAAVPGHWHPGRHRHAAQPVPALVGRADARGVANRRRQARSHRPVAHRHHRLAAAGAADQRRDSDRGSRRLPRAGQHPRARHRRRLRVAGARGRHGHGGHPVRAGAAGVRPKLHVHGHDCGPGDHGRLFEAENPVLATAPDHARTGTDSRHDRRADAGRTFGRQTAGAEPGRAQPATAVCHVSVDQPDIATPHHGRIRQRLVDHRTGVAAVRGDFGRQCMDGVAGVCGLISTIAATGGRVSMRDAPGAPPSAAAGGTWARVRKSYRLLTDRTASAKARLMDSGGLPSDRPRTPVSIYREGEVDMMAAMRFAVMLSLTSVIAYAYAQHPLDQQLAQLTPPALVPLQGTGWPAGTLLCPLTPYESAVPGNSKVARRVNAVLEKNRFRGDEGHWSLIVIQPATTGDAGIEQLVFKRRNYDVVRSSSGLRGATTSVPAGFMPKAGEDPDDAGHAQAGAEDGHDGRPHPGGGARAQAQHRQGGGAVARHQQRHQRRQRHEAAERHAVQRAEQAGNGEIADEQMRHVKEQRRGDGTADRAHPDHRVAQAKTGGQSARHQVADDIADENDGHQAQPLFQRKADHVHEVTGQDHEKAEHRRPVTSAVSRRPAPGASNRRHPSRTAAPANRRSPPAPATARTWPARRSSARRNLPPANRAWAGPPRTPPRTSPLPGPVWAPAWRPRSTPGNRRRTAGSRSRAAHSQRSSWCNSSGPRPCSGTGFQTPPRLPRRATSRAVVPRYSIAHRRTRNRWPPSRRRPPTKPQNNGRGMPSLADRRSSMDGAETAGRGDARGVLVFIEVKLIPAKNVAFKNAKCVQAIDLTRFFRRRQDEIGHVIERGRQPAQRRRNRADQRRMPHFVVIDFLDRHVLRAQRLRQVARVALRVHQLVAARGDQQGRRRLCRDVPDRLRRGRRRGKMEHGPGGVIFHRQEIVGTGQPDPAAQVGRRHALRRQPARIERHHRRVVGAGAVAHHEQALRVAAKARRVAPGPGHGLRRVGEKIGIGHCRVQPVIGHHGDDAARGQGPADKRIVAALAADPVAAVKKHHDGRRAVGLRGQRPAATPSASSSARISRKGRERRGMGRRWWWQCRYSRGRPFRAPCGALPKLPGAGLDYSGRVVGQRITAGKAAALLRGRGFDQLEAGRGPGPCGPGAAIENAAPLAHAGEPVVFERGIHHVAVAAVTVGHLDPLGPVGRPVAGGPQFIARLVGAAAAFEHEQDLAGGQAMDAVVAMVVGDVAIVFATAVCERLDDGRQQARVVLARSHGRQGPHHGRRQRGQHGAGRPGARHGQRSGSTHPALHVVELEQRRLHAGQRQAPGALTGRDLRRAGVEHRRQHLCHLLRRQFGIGLQAAHRDLADTHRQRALGLFAILGHRHELGPDRCVGPGRARQPQHDGRELVLALIAGGLAAARVIARHFPVLEREMAGAGRTGHQCQRQGRPAQEGHRRHLQLDEMLAVVLELFDRFDDVGQRRVHLVLFESGDHGRRPALAQLFQRGHVDIAIVEIRLQLRHVAHHEAAVLADGIAAHRRFAFWHPLLHESDDLLFRLRFGDGGRLDLVDQARAAVGALVPGVHAVQHFIALVNHQHRAFGQHVQVHVGDDHGHFDDAVGVRLEAGHFHVDPDQNVYPRVFDFVCFFHRFNADRPLLAGLAPDPSRARAPQRRAARIRRAHPAGSAPEGRRLHGSAHQVRPAGPGRQHAGADRFYLAGRPAMAVGADFPGHRPRHGVPAGAAGRVCRRRAGRGHRPAAGVGDAYPDGKIGQPVVVVRVAGVERLPAADDGAVPHRDCAAVQQVHAAGRPVAQGAHRGPDDARGLCLQGPVRDGRLETQRPRQRLFFRLRRPQAHPQAHRQAHRHDVCHLARFPGAAGLPENPALVLHGPRCRSAGAARPDQRRHGAAAVPAGAARVHVPVRTADVDQFAQARVRSRRLCRPAHRGARPGVGAGQDPHEQTTATTAHRHHHCRPRPPLPGGSGWPQIAVRHARQENQCGRRRHRASHHHVQRPGRDRQDRGTQDLAVPVRPVQIETAGRESDPAVHCRRHRTRLCRRPGVALAGGGRGGRHRGAPDPQQDRRDSVARAHARAGARVRFARLPGARSVGHGAPGGSGGDPATADGGPVVDPDRPVRHGQVVADQPAGARSRHRRARNFGRARHRQAHHDLYPAVPAARTGSGLVDHRFARLPGVWPLPFDGGHARACVRRIQALSWPLQVLQLPPPDRAPVRGARSGSGRQDRPHAPYVVWPAAARAAPPTLPRPVKDRDGLVRTRRRTRHCARRAAGPRRPGRAVHHPPGAARPGADRRPPGTGGGGSGLAGRRTGACRPHGHRHRAADAGARRLARCGRLPLAACLDRHRRRRPPARRRAPGTHGRLRAPPRTRRPRTPGVRRSGTGPLGDDGKPLRGRSALGRALPLGRRRLSAGASRMGAGFLRHGRRPGQPFRRSRRPLRPRVRGSAHQRPDARGDHRRHQHRHRLHQPERPPRGARMDAARAGPGAAHQLAAQRGRIGAAARRPQLRHCPALPGRPAARHGRLRGGAGHLPPPAGACGGTGPRGPDVHCAARPGARAVLPRPSAGSAGGGVRRHRTGGGAIEPVQPCARAARAVGDPHAPRAAAAGRHDGTQRHPALPAPGARAGPGGDQPRHRHAGAPPDRARTRRRPPSPRAGSVGSAPRPRAAADHGHAGAAVGHRPGNHHAPRRQRRVPGDQPPRAGAAGGQQLCHLPVRSGLRYAQPRIRRGERHAAGRQHHRSGQSARQRRALPARAARNLRGGRGTGRHLPGARHAADGLRAVRAADGGRARAGRDDGAGAKCQRLPRARAADLPHPVRLRRHCARQRPGVRTTERRANPAGIARKAGGTGVADGRRGARTQYADRQQPADRQHPAPEDARPGCADQWARPAPLGAGRVSGRRRARARTGDARPDQRGGTGQQLQAGGGGPHHRAAPGVRPAAGGGRSDRHHDEPHPRVRPPHRRGGGGAYRHGQLSRSARAGAGQFHQQRAAARVCQGRRGQTVAARRPAARPSGPGTAGLRRQWRRHRSRPHVAHLRSVLHDQAGTGWQRPGTVDQLQHRHLATGRADRGPQFAGGHRVYARSAAGGAGSAGAGRGADLSLKGARPRTISGRSAFSDFTLEEYEYVIERAHLIKRKFKNYEIYHPLIDRTLVMVFEKNSTRTRLSFEAGMHQLGGAAIYLNTRDSQLGRGEPVEDAGQVMSRMCDIIMVRTFGQDIIERFAAHSRVPVINGLTNEHHPCQVFADIFTFYEHRGAITGKTVAWIGDANNMLYSWLQAAEVFGFHVNVSTPKGYDMDMSLVSTDRYTFFANPSDACEGAHLVNTDVWTSMGYEEENAARLKAFDGWIVDGAKMARAAPDALFMHCLPAHRGEEVAAEVIDGPQSVVWDEAENRLHIQKALIEIRARLRVPDVPRQYRVRRRIPAGHLDRASADRQAPDRNRQRDRRRRHLARRHRQGQRPGALRTGRLCAQTGRESDRPMARVGPAVARKTAEVRGRRRHRHRHEAQERRRAVLDGRQPAAHFVRGPSPGKPERRSRGIDVALEREPGSGARPGGIPGPGIRKRRHRGAERRAHVAGHRADGTQSPGRQARHRPPGPGGKPLRGHEVARLLRNPGRHHHAQGPPRHRVDHAGPRSGPPEGRPDAALRVDDLQRLLVGAGAPGAANPDRPHASHRQWLGARQTLQGQRDRGYQEKTRDGLWRHRRHHRAAAVGGLCQFHQPLARCRVGPAYAAGAAGGEPHRNGAAADPDIHPGLHAHRGGKPHHHHRCRRTGGAKPPGRRAHADAGQSAPAGTLEAARAADGHLDHARDPSAAGKTPGAQPPGRRIAAGGHVVRRGGRCANAGPGAQHHRRDQRRGKPPAGAAGAGLGRTARHHDHVAGSRGRAGGRRGRRHRRGAHARAGGAAGPPQRRGGPRSGGHQPAALQGRFAAGRGVQGRRRRFDGQDRGGRRGRHRPPGPGAGAHVRQPARAAAQHPAGRHPGHHVCHADRRIGARAGSHRHRARPDHCGNPEHHARNLVQCGRTAQDHAGRHHGGRLHHQRHRRSAGQPAPHGRHHAGHGQRHGLDQRQAGGAVRKGVQHQQRTGHHHQGGRPDQPALAERRDRGGKGRRGGTRLFGRGHRDPAPGRPDLGVHLGHRADAQGDAVGGVGQRDGHGQIFGGDPAQRGRGARGDRPALGRDGPGAQAVAAIRPGAAGDALAGGGGAADHRDHAAAERSYPAVGRCAQIHQRGGAPVARLEHQTQIVRGLRRHPGHHPGAPDHRVQPLQQPVGSQPVGPPHDGCDPGHRCAAQRPAAGAGGGARLLPDRHRGPPRAHPQGAARHSRIDPEAAAAHQGQPGPGHPLRQAGVDDRGVEQGGDRIAAGAARKTGRPARRGRRHRPHAATGQCGQLRHQRNLQIHGRRGRRGASPAGRALGRLHQPAGKHAAGDHGGRHGLRAAGRRGGVAAGGVPDSAAVQPHPGRDGGIQPHGAVDPGQPGQRKSRQRPAARQARARAGPHVREFAVAAQQRAEGRHPGHHVRHRNRCVGQAAGGHRHRAGANQRGNPQHHQGNLGQRVAAAQDHGGSDRRRRLHHQRHRRRPGQPAPHGQHHAAHGERDRLHQRQAGGAVRKGVQYQQCADHHHQGGRPDQHPVAQRRHRGGKGRRSRPRLLGRGHRDPPPGGPDVGVHLGHRADAQGNAIGRLGQRDGHGQILGGDPPQRGRSAPGDRPAVRRDGPGAEARPAVRRRAAGDAVAGRGRGADQRHHDAAERRHPADGGVAQGHQRSGAPAAVRGRRPADQRGQLRRCGVSGHETARLPHRRRPLWLAPARRGAGAAVARAQAPAAGARSGRRPDGLSRRLGAGGGPVPGQRHAARRRPFRHPHHRGQLPRARRHGALAGTARRAGAGRAGRGGRSAHRERCQGRAVPGPGSGRRARHAATGGTGPPAHACAAHRPLSQRRRAVMTPAQTLVRAATGLNLSKAIIDRALRTRVTQTGAPDVDAYLDGMTPDELTALVELVVVPESWFYRDQQAFHATADYLKQQLLLDPNRLLHVLSLPCAGGEEPYTMAMVLLDAGIPANRFLIDAFDISPGCVARAKDGVYGRNAFRSQDLAFRERYFSSLGGDAWRIDDAVRKQVRFHQGNALEMATTRRSGFYDVIFCRNLLIYFDKPTTKAAIQNLDLMLKRDGLLFVGYAEVPSLCANGFAPLPYAQAFGLIKDAEAAARKKAAAAAVQAPSAPLPALAPASAPAPRRPAPRALRPAPPAPPVPLRTPAPAPVARPAAPAAPAAPATDRIDLLKEARRLADLGQLKEAERHSRDHLAQQPESAEAYFILGLVNELTNKHVQAEDYWKRCIYLQPDHYEALCHLALLAETNSDPVTAAALKARAARIYKRQQASAAQRNLQRPVGVDYKREWAAHFRRAAADTQALDASCLVFRIGREWLSLPTKLFVAVAPQARPHRLPHRTGRGLTGIVNVGGTLYPCMSLAALLGIDDSEGEAATHRHTFARLLLIQWEDQAYALPVADLHGIQRYATASVQAPAATINKGLSRFLSGVIAIDDMHWRPEPVLDAGPVPHGSGQPDPDPHRRPAGHGAPEERRHGGGVDDARRAFDQGGGIHRRPRGGGADRAQHGGRVHRRPARQAGAHAQPGGRAAGRGRPDLAAVAIAGQRRGCLAGRQRNPDQADARLHRHHRLFAGTGEPAGGDGMGAARCTGTAFVPIRRTADRARFVGAIRAARRRRRPRPAGAAGGNTGRSPGAGGRETCAKLRPAAVAGQRIAHQRTPDAAVHPGPAALQAQPGQPLFRDRTAARGHFQQRRSEIEGTVAAGAAKDAAAQAVRARTHRRHRGVRAPLVPAHGARPGAQPGQGCAVADHRRRHAGGPRHPGAHREPAQPHAAQRHRPRHGQRGGAHRRRQAWHGHRRAGGQAPRRHAQYRDQRRWQGRGPGKNPYARDRAQNGQCADGGGHVGRGADGVSVFAGLQSEGKHHRDFGARRGPRHRARNHPLAERHGAHRVRTGGGLPHLYHAAPHTVDRARAGGGRQGRSLCGAHRAGRTRDQGAAVDHPYAGKQAVLRFRRRTSGAGVSLAGAGPGRHRRRCGRTAGGGDRQRRAPLCAGGGRHQRRTKPGGAGHRPDFREDARHLGGRPARQRRSGPDPGRARPAAVDRQAAARRRAAPAYPVRPGGAPQDQARAGGGRLAHGARNGAQAAAKPGLPGRYRDRRHRRLERGAQRGIRPGDHRRRHAAHGRRGAAACGGQHRRAPGAVDRPYGRRSGAHVRRAAPGPDPDGPEHAGARRRVPRAGRGRARRHRHAGAARAARRRLRAAGQDPHHGQADTPQRRQPGHAPAHVAGRQRRRRRSRQRHAGRRSRARDVAAGHRRLHRRAGGRIENAGGMGGAARLRGGGGAAHRRALCRQLRALAGRTARYAGAHGRRRRRTGGRRLRLSAIGRCILQLRGAALEGRRGGRAVDRHGPRRRRGPAGDAPCGPHHHRPGPGQQRSVWHAARRRRTGGGADDFTAHQDRTDPAQHIGKPRLTGAPSDRKRVLMSEATALAAVNATAAADPEQALTAFKVRVLLVDDQLIIVEAVRRMLSDQADIEFHYVTDATLALQTAVQLQPTVILQDLVMPTIDGFGLIHQYRSDDSLRHIPVIVLSAKEDPKLKAHSFATGANDYMVKLPDKLELLARVRYHSGAHISRLQRDQAFRFLRESQKSLADANIELQKLAALDALTGIANRRRFDETMRVEWQRGQRDKKPLTLLMCDVDFFKVYNDSFGHLAGDLALKKVAAVLTEHLKRPADLAARYGGEEFVIILPETPLAGALIVAESCRRHLEQLAIENPQATTALSCVTMSIGVASVVPSPKSSIDELIQHADQALYTAKSGGRNRVESAGQLPGPLPAST
uniref:ornithine carbamoyltransferase n=1 Tax=Tanacetum cinerariifolium TaxID=118510 RepID=A0A699GHT7_TANCI|nr:ornithine carbamoyltransferase, chloroplastic [Tanacetum cinerariifolium]